MKRVLEADLATIEALIHVQAGDLEAAFSCGRAIELDPERSLAWVMRAQLALTLGRLDEALDDVRRAGELAPEDYRLVALRAAILQRQGDLAGLAETARVLDEHAGQLVDQLAAQAASGVSSLQGSISGTLGADLAAAQELTALAVSDGTLRSAASARTRPRPRRSISRASGLRPGSRRAHPRDRADGVEPET